MTAAYYGGASYRGAPPSAGAPLAAFFARRVSGYAAVLSGQRYRPPGPSSGRIRPSLTPLRLSEAALMLQGLYQVNLEQLRSGQVAPISFALHKGSSLGSTRDGRLLRYIRSDPRERWQTVRDIWQTGGGDCEDLAAAVAAELTLKGVPARPVIYRVRDGLAHAVVQDLETGQLIDPSKTGGMGEVDIGRRPRRFY